MQFPGDAQPTRVSYISGWIFRPSDPHNWQDIKALDPSAEDIGVDTNAYSSGAELVYAEPFRS